MIDCWSVGAALFAVIGPIALAWWLLGGRERRLRTRGPRRTHGKMQR